LDWIVQQTGEIARKNLNNSAAYSLAGVAKLSGATHKPQAPARGAATPRWRLGLVNVAPGSLAAPQPALFVSSALFISRQLTAVCRDVQIMENQQFS